MFGDRDMKKLKASLEAGRLSIRVAVQAGRVETTVNNAGNAILDATAPLVQKGRREEALAAIAEARASGDDAPAQLWNELLVQVEQHV